MRLSVGPDTLWIAAQEIITTDHVDQWMLGLESRSYVTRDTIGISHEGRPVSLAVWPTVSKGEAYVLYLLPEGRIEFTGK